MLNQQLDEFEKFDDESYDIWVKSYKNQDNNYVNILRYKIIY